MLNKEELQKEFKYSNGKLIRKSTNKECGWKDHGYLRVSYKNNKYYIHRIIWVMQYGYEPNIIDHIDGNRLNNDLNNLRDVSHRENALNSKKRSTNKSGTMGVFYEKIHKKWNAHIWNNYKKINLGYFDNKQDAINVRIKAEKEYGYHENHGRL